MMIMVVIMLTKKMTMIMVIMVIKMVTKMTKVHGTCQSLPGGAGRQGKARVSILKFSILDR